MSLEAIKWVNSELVILDQLLLPYKSSDILVDSVDKGWEVIHNMQVRGAPAIAIVGCLSLASELIHKEMNGFNCQMLHSYVSSKLDYLSSARPTAINMINAAEQLKVVSHNLANEAASLQDMKEKIILWCVKMLEDDVKTNKLLGNYGMEAILNNSTTQTGKVVILTHCNTGSLATGGYGTALGVARSIASHKMLEHIYCTETRPYNQGSRLTAYELVHDKLPATLICDSMVAALMNERNIDAVVVGADRVARNGDTANKIGTYQLAVVAKYHNVPFYVCCPLSSIDFKLEDGTCIPIEERPPHELLFIAGKEIAAPGIGCWNPAFDVTPACLITGGIVTEIGVFNPSELCGKVQAHKEIMKLN